MYFFSLCMKAPGRSPDNPRRCNDTRYSLSRRLCASTLAAFVAEPLGGTTSRALKKKRNKGLAAGSEGIRAKLIWIQQCEHIGGVFSFTGGTNRTERAGLQVKAGFFVFKDVKKKNTTEKKLIWSCEMSFLKLLWSENKAKAAVFPFAYPSFVHVCFR